jgi:hypothetical protein
MRGIDMDDLLSSDPGAFRSLRVFEQRSFIKLDDEEDRAFRTTLLRRNLDALRNPTEDNTFGYDYLTEHARIAERHTGTGLTADYITQKGLPLPTGRTYAPQSIYEQLICYADKFFSKTKLDQEKSLEKVEASLAKWEDASLQRFKAWTLTFYQEHQFPTKPSLV